MSTKITIGHASISEKGTITGDAGDSTGYEVCTKDDFDILSKNYNVVLRPKTAALASKSANVCEAGCANNKIGYSQSSRNTLYTLAKKINSDLSKVDLSDVGLCNTDCSAFMTVCALCGGANIEYGTNAPTTTTMRTRFKQSGDYVVLTDSKYTKQTDYLKRGDILVCEGSHTVMVLGNGISISNDEEAEPEEPATPGGLTTTLKMTVRSVELNLAAIDTTRASIVIKVLEQKTDSTAKVMSANKVDKYTWTYKLENLSNGTSVTNKLQISSGTYKLNLASLTKETDYALQVFATKAGQPKFCSQKMLFSTNVDDIEKPTENQVFLGDDTNVVDKIYIKIKDKFHTTIIYKM